MTPARRGSGFTVIEVLFALAVLSVVTGIAIPLAASAADELRTAAGARDLAGRIARVRMEAVMRSTSVALRFERSGSDYVYTAYADGNGNGVRSADIRAGLDPAVRSTSRLGDNFVGVHFGLGAGMPDADGSLAGGTEGVRIGSARILSVSPDGTATSGTLYIQGRAAQYAVRVLGATGRTRVLRYDRRSRTWSSR